MIDELIQLAKELQAATQRGEDPGLNPIDTSNFIAGTELAFHCKTTSH